MRKIELIKPARLILLCGAIAGAVSGCSSALPSLGSNDRRSGPGSGSAYASGSCFYSDNIGAERRVAGRVFHWCGPEPRAVD